MERNKLPVSVQIILTKENKVLLLKRKNTGFADEMYGFPGGHVEKNENVINAIIRETKEETNLDIDRNDLILQNVMNRKLENGEYIDFVFKCTNWNGQPKIMEPHKCSEIIFVDIDNLPENIIDFEKELLNNSTHSLLIEWGW